MRIGSAERARVIEALEAALRVGQGRVNVYVAWPTTSGREHPYSIDALEVFDGAALRGLRHPLPEPTPSLFSFNSPLGACETCRGFGRVIGIDYGLVDSGRVEDAARTAPSGPGRPKSYKECQDDLVKYAQEARHPARHAVARAHRRPRRWVIEGEGQVGNWSKSALVWRARFFEWLETKATRCTCACCCRYRAYTPCKPARCAPEAEALLWRLAVDRRGADRAALPPAA